MDFLLDYGIDKETIDKILENNINSVIRQFICDKENVIEIIKYLKESKVSVIDDLLIRRIEIFMINSKSFIKAFDKYNKNILVALINEDISAINFL